MRPVSRRFAICSSVALLIQACLPTEPCACTPLLGHAVVYGSVESAAGDAVPGVEMKAKVYGSICGREPAQSFRPLHPVRTDSAGVYELPVYSAFGAHAACVRVIAHHPSPAAESTFVDVAVSLRSERDEPARVRVDLVLQ